MEKAKIRIAADSTCDLPENIIKQYDIAIIHHYVNTVYGRFLDKEEVTSDNVIEYMSMPNKRLDTTPPSVKDYEEFYKECLKSCDNLVHILMSKNSSKSYTYALEASKKFDNVYVINSKSISVGYGMIVMKAAELCHGGVSAETLIKEIKEYRELIDVKFVMQSLEALHRGGRCSASLVDFTNFFKVHMGMCIKNGKIQGDRAYIGKMQNVYNHFIRKSLSTRNIDTRTLFIVTVGCSNSMIEEFLRWIEKYCKFDNVFVMQASSTISCHSGAGTLALGYAKFNMK